MNSKCGIATIANLIILICSWILLFYGFDWLSGVCFGVGVMNMLWIVNLWDQVFIKQWRKNYYLIKLLNKKQKREDKMSEQEQIINIQRETIDMKSDTIDCLIKQTEMLEDIINIKDSTIERLLQKVNNLESSKRWTP